MADEQKTVKEASLEQEERISKLFKGERTPRSGGANFVSGDALSEDWLVECKTTVQPKNSYTVTKAVMDKADQERSEMHKSYYALAFTMGENKDDYFVLDKRTMKAMLDQKEAIKKLISAVKRELSTVELNMTNLKKRGVPGPVELASYNAHKAEKMATLAALEKLL